MKLLQKNNVGFGIVMGLLGPIAAFGVLYLINAGLVHWFNDGQEVLQQDTILMTSLFMNLFIYIPYLKKDTYERTGRGILLVTFIGVVILFITMI